MQQLRPNQKYWTLVSVQDDGRIKVEKAQRLVKYNQHRASWEQVNSREMARALNHSELVIK